MGRPMTTSPIDQFFATLRDRGHEPLLEKVSGTVRFDVGHGQQTDHWMITIRNGDVTVTREDADADAVVRVARHIFEQLATGQMNAMAALLRGQVAAEGNLELPVLVQRLLPGPPRGQQAHPEAAPTLPPGATATAGAHAGAGPGSSDTDSGRR
jgi:putative sterol carrier protein